MKAAVITSQHSIKASQLRRSLIDRKGRLTTVFGCTITLSVARWQSGYAAVCKTVYIGSIPVRASTRFFPENLPSFLIVICILRCNGAKLFAALN